MRKDVLNQLQWCIYGEKLKQNRALCRRDNWKQALSATDSRIISDACKNHSDKVEQELEAESWATECSKLCQLDPKSEANDTVLISENDDADVADLSADGLVQHIASSSKQNAQDLAITNIKVYPERKFLRNIPCSREGATLTMCNVSLVLFGGRFQRDESMLLPSASIEKAYPYHYSNEVFCMDLTSNCWALVSCSGSEPPGRCDHTATFVKPNNIFVYGGRGQAGSVFGDLYALTLNTWTWSQIESIEDPAPRYWHCTAICSKSNILCVFGGKDLKVVHDDFWCFDLSSCDDRTRQRNKWYRPLTLGANPAPSFGAALIDIGHNRLFYASGWNHGYVGKDHFMPMELRILELENMIWMPILQPSHIVGAPPPSRRFSFQCYLLENTIIIVGGYVYPFSRLGKFVNTGYAEINEPFIYRFDLENRIWTHQSLTRIVRCRYGAPNAIRDGMMYAFENCDGVNDQLIAFKRL